MTNNKQFKEEMIKGIVDENKGFYHLRITEIMNILVKKYPKLIKNNETFKLTSTKRHSVDISEYEPDYAIKIEVRKRIYGNFVFEFIDKQSDIKTIADFYRTLLIENCRKVIFIVNETKKHKKTEEIGHVLISKTKSLFQLKSEKKFKDKDILDYAVVHIPIDMTDDEMENKIIKEIQKAIKINNKN